MNELLQRITKGRQHDKQTARHPRARGITDHVFRRLLILLNLTFDYLECGIQTWCRLLGGLLIVGLKVEDLTFNAGRVKSHVRRLVSCGGMDIAEDVLGGLEAVAQLGWGPPSSRKVVVHFADAPCHGSKFHDLGPGGDALFDMKKCTAQYNGRTVGEALKVRTHAVQIPLWV